MGNAYDFGIATMLDDGFFAPDGLDVPKNSFVELGMLKEKPSDEQILTTQFVPVMP